MNRLFKYLLCMLASVAVMPTFAQENFACIYKSWENILDNYPDTVVYDVAVEISTPYSINVKPRNGKDKIAKDLLKKQALAISINDSVWFLNANYLKNHYSGYAVPYLKNYIPLYFNDKIAYTQYTNDVDNSFIYDLAEYISNNNMGTVQALQLITSYGFNFGDAYIFTIDVKNKTVDALNDAALSKLLAHHLDIRKRYESMYLYQEPSVINYYFLQYIDAILYDDSVPYLLE